MILQVDAEKYIQQMEEEIHCRGVDLDYITFSYLLQQS